MQAYKDIVFQYLNGQLSIEQEVQLLGWLRADEANRLLFKQWKKEWISSYASVSSTDEAWSRFVTKHPEAAAQQPTVQPLHSFIPSPLHHYWQRIAACALLVLGLGAGYYWLRPSSQAPQSDMERSELAQAMTSVSAANGPMTYMLPDSTKVVLNTGSELSYDASFGAVRREVHLEGEGYFEVTKDKAHEFAVFADGVEVVVTGTKFNISAYQQDEQAVVTLLEGSVIVRNESFEADLIPNEQLAYVSRSGELVKRVCESNEAIAWIDGRMEYDHIRLGELFRRLGRYYNRTIIVEDEAINRMDAHFAMDEPHELDELLSALADVYQLRVNQRGETISISAK